MIVAEKSPRILTIEISEAGAVELRTLLGEISYLNGPLSELHCGLVQQNVGEEHFPDLFEIAGDGLEYVNR